MYLKNREGESQREPERESQREKAREREREVQWIRSRERGLLQWIVLLFSATHYTRSNQSLTLL